MDNNLFGFLVSRGIFKNNGRYQRDGSRILASERTEMKRAEKNRGNFVWRSKNVHPLAGKSHNQGTLIKQQNR